MSAKLSQFIEYRDIEMIDLDHIYSMECQSYDFPWTRNILKDCIIKRYDSYLAIYNNIIVGYIISKVTPFESHVLNLTVNKEYRNNGIGSELLEMVIRKCTILKSEMLLLETRLTNRSAIALYEKYGFKKIGFRKDYYKTSLGKEDAIVFKKTLD
jgi:ribosomal-protein-alanine N-acetyltransferase